MNKPEFTEEQRKPKIIRIFNCKKCEDKKEFYVQLAYLEPFLVTCDECGETEK